MKDAGSKLQAITGIKTYDMIQYVTGFLEGEFTDWPAQIQDKIMEALELKAAEVELPLTIIHARCDIDYGEKGDGSDDRPYIHVIASEIVVADERGLRREKDQMRELISDIISGRRTH